jgi:hypothetical protein
VIKKLPPIAEQVPRYQTFGDAEIVPSPFREPRQRQFVFQQ